MGSGLFDAYPRLTIILGHMGEGLPFSVWRVDHTNSWIEDRHSYSAKKKIVDYFNANFYLTTSGNFRTQALNRTGGTQRRASRCLIALAWGEFTRR